MLESPAHKQQ